MSFISVLTAIGKAFEKGLVWAIKYAIPVEKLVAELFPSEATVAQSVVDAASLVQNAVLLVEQKYAASGVQNGSGPAKLAEVLTLTQAAVTSLLAQEKITVDTTYVTNLVNAVVAILNLQDGTAVS